MKIRSNLAGYIELQRGLGIAAEDRCPRASASRRDRRASTGPRHRCRGSACASTSRRSCTPCFNGASASLPRIGRSRDRVRAGQEASTGPRHRCRGSRDGKAWRGRDEVASTGPRHRCRGSDISNQFDCTVATVLQRGLGIAAEDRDGDVIGAAHVISASTGPRHRCRGSIIMSNGNVWGPYASTGPRHRCRGSRSSSCAISSSTRRFNGASASLPRIGRGCRRRARALPRASTGPRHRCRGSHRSCRSAKHPRSCFNGASASLPRIVPDALRVLPHVFVLQRGLGIAAEDRELRGGGRDVAEVASTGPRHRCRGSW